MIKSFKHARVLFGHVTRTRKNRAELQAKSNNIDRTLAAFDGR